MTNITIKQRPHEQLRTLSAETYRAAYKKGMSLSAYLERESPSSEFNDGLDAFTRLLKLANITTRSLPAYGVYADTFDRFYESEQNRALLPEFIARIYRRVATGREVSTRALYTSDDSAVGGIDNPWVVSGSPRWDAQLAAAIPVSELIAVETPIDNDAYTAYYLTSSTENQRAARVAEGADIPVFKLSGGDHTIRLKKFGAGMEMTYEQIRRQRIDRMALHIARIAVQDEVDKLAAIIDVLVSGDGNSGTSATNYNLTTLDSGASAGTLSLKGYIAFKMKFANPYAMTHALVKEDVALQMLLLNTGSGNTPLVSIQSPSGFGSFNAINPGLADGVRLGWTSDAPTLKIVGLDARAAIERVSEIGSDVQETERFIRNQTQVLTMTQVEAFVKLDPAAVNTLDVNA